LGHSAKLVDFCAEKELANEAVHRMSGNHALFKFGRLGVPVIGDFGR
jgi:hypothetical protein